MCWSFTKLTFFVFYRLSGGYLSSRLFWKLVFVLYRILSMKQRYYMKSREYASLKKHKTYPWFRNTFTSFEGRWTAAIALWHADGCPWSKARYLAQITLGVSVNICIANIKSRFLSFYQSGVDGLADRKNNPLCKIWEEGTFWRTFLNSILWEKIRS